MDKTPYGALTEQQLYSPWQHKFRGGRTDPSKTDPSKKYYSVHKNIYSSKPKIISEKNSGGFNFKAGGSLYYFDNYFHAFAYALRQGAHHGK